MIEIWRSVMLAVAANCAQRPERLAPLRVKLPNRKSHEASPLRTVRYPRPAGARAQFAVAVRATVA